MKISIYDTTLRDGTQGEGVQLSVADKLFVTELLDDLGVAYIEGGWPGSNPRDETYFTRVARLRLDHARLTAFGATRRAGIHCDDDPSLQAMLRSGTPAVTIFGKSWEFQASHALGISAEENLELVEDSVRYMKSRVEEVIFDAEHFFDGFKDDEQYALSVLRAAISGGADQVVLCDTNGGTLTEEVTRAVKIVAETVEVPLGVHTHNDAEMAVANSVAAVAAGVTMVQGTINGVGERCGNANLISVIPALELKMGHTCLTEGKLKKLTHVAHTIDEISNRPPQESQPYVGRSAFAHKGGVHSNAVMKDHRTYEHIEPVAVGNRHRFLVSDLSGRASIHLKAKEFGIELTPDDPSVEKILSRLKVLENEGYQFEGAEASFKLMMDRACGRHTPYFNLHDLEVKVCVGRGDQNDPLMLSSTADACIKLGVGDVRAEVRSEGDGPVHAIDRALRKLIDKFYPGLKNVYLVDYKVRVLSGGKATASVVRVLIISSDGTDEWGTVGVSDNIIEASWQALADALEYKLVKDGVVPHT